MTIKKLYVLAAMGLFITPLFADARNILLFTADDLHSETLATYGSKLDITPNLDAFAKTAMVFDKGHVNAAICSPSRKIIGTGLYGHNSGAVGFAPATPGTPDIINTLNEAGYLTGIVDKVEHSTPSSATRWDVVIADKKNRNETAYGRSPSLFYKHVNAFLDRSKAEDKPFYLMVNSRDPHRPFCEATSLGHPLAEKPSRFFTPKETELPGFLPDLPQVRKELAMYQNSCRRLDDTFGKVMQALEESGLAEETMVIFMSDNGQAMPFAKANTYFYATKTPVIVRLPGVTKPNTRDTQHYVSGVDFFPTFLEYTGVEGPERLDGRSFFSLLKGEGQENRDHVYTQIDTLSSGSAYPMRAIQEDSFIYVFNPFSDGSVRYKNANEGKVMAAMEQSNDPLINARAELFRHRVPQELYDLSKDQDCLHNLVDNPEYTKQLDRLKQRLVASMKTSQDPMLEAWEVQDDRAALDSIIRKVYGAKKPGKKKKNKKSRKKK